MGGIVYHTPPTPMETEVSDTAWNLRTYILIYFFARVVCSIVMWGSYMKAQSSRYSLRFITCSVASDTQGIA